MYRENVPKYKIKLYKQTTLNILHTPCILPKNQKENGFITNQTFQNRMVVY
jgi:hypothetical protein